MSRVATIELLYVSDLSAEKAKYQAYKQYVEENPPHIQYKQPGSGPATTFGGVSTDSGQGSISTLRPSPIAAAPVVNNYYYGTGSAPTAAPPSPSSSSPAMAGRMSTEWAFATSHSGGGFSPAPTVGTAISQLLDNYTGAGRSGGSATYNGNRGWTGGPRRTASDEIFEGEYTVQEQNRLGYDPSYSGSHGTYSGGPPATEDSGDNAPTGGSRWGPGSRRGSGGMRNLLASEGFRGSARLFGAYSIAEAGVGLLKQSNEYGIQMGGATTSDQVIEAQKQYGENNPAYKLPLIGDFYSEINEARFGERAELASRQASTRIGDQNFDILNNSRSTSEMMKAAVASAGGDVAGQRDALGINYRNTITTANTYTSGQVTRIQGDIDALGGDGPGSEYGLGKDVREQLRKARAGDAFAPKTLTEADADKIANLAAQRKDLQYAHDRFVSNAGAEYGAQDAQLLRSANATEAGSSYRVAAIRNQFGNARQSNIDAITGAYQERIKKAPTGSPEAIQADAEMRAALENERKEYARDTQIGSRQTAIGVMQDQGSILSSQHHDYLAGQAGIEAQRKQAGLDYDQNIKVIRPFDKDQVQRITDAHTKYISTLNSLDGAAAGLAADFHQKQESMQGQHVSTLELLRGNRFAASEAATNQKYDDLSAQHKDTDYTQARADEHAMNAMQRNLSNDQYNLGTMRIGQHTNSQNLRNAHMGLTASVNDIINSGSNQIVETDLEMRGPENAKARSARVANIRADTLSMVKGELGQLKYGGLEEVSPFVMGGNPNNFSSKDYPGAIHLGEGADKALDRADTAGKAAADRADPNAPKASQLDKLDTNDQKVLAMLKAILG